MQNSTVYKTGLTFCFLLLISTEWGCTVQDHQPDTCSEVQALLDGCPAGFTLFAEIARVTGDVTPNQGTALVVAPGDITTGLDGCYYKENKIASFEGNTSLLITTPAFLRQYECSE
ncbi:hypothetical protein ACO2Q8_17525 [Larkinella sp. VNQ87]